MIPYQRKSVLQNQTIEKRPGNNKKLAIISHSIDKFIDRNDEAPFPFHEPISKERYQHYGKYTALELHRARKLISGLSQDYH